ncbi:hypothetical protein SAMN04488029_0958 [Reichenbachiella faecimaris]|uniref:Hydroxyneurosporene synthase (CrtC) n=1 Tax=Reichenbachiella faecimaris TaxID=692418 RepID=A0A1W2G7E8_REIFA|nr:hypothetical protein [Reichenbachiella faecimaris]SMD32609.1 hypothetical protein SAMN04488029_0958 [Reichenbachiella faecimaris]
MSTLRLIASLMSILFISSHHSIAQPLGPKGFDQVYSKRLDKQHNEFDFWLGNWDVTWQRWAGGDAYQPTNISQHRVFAALDGKALIEMAYEDSVVNNSKTAGFSIRYFDDNLQKWVMFQSWPGKNSTNFSSLQGTHHHKRIQLYKNGITTRPFRGHPIGTSYINRYTFSDTHPESFRWESSISLDSMETWATLSIAEGTKIPDFTSLQDDSKQWYTLGDKYNCSDSILAPLQPYLGTWSGEISYKDGKQKSKYKVERVLKPFLSNCAALGYQINYKEGKTQKEIIFVGYLTASDQWIFYTLNDRMGESHKTFFSEQMSDEVVFTKKDTLDVTSSGNLKAFSWKANQPNKQTIEGAIPDKSWSFKMELMREELD